MNNKRIYALTDAEAETLRLLARESATTVSNYALDALTPLDTDAAVERMARALAESLHGGDFWDDYADDGSTLIINREGYRSDARAAFDALLQEDK